VHRIKSTKRATLETKAYKPQKKALADTDTGGERERERERVSYPTPNNRNPQEFSSTQEDLTHMKSRKKKNSNTKKKKKSKSDNSALKTHTKLQTATLLTALSEKPKREKGGKITKTSGNFWCKSQELQERSPSALNNRAQISARGNPSDFEEAISR
jgi:hypothetical protein